MIILRLSFYRYVVLCKVGSTKVRQLVFEVSRSTQHFTQYFNRIKNGFLAFFRITYSIGYVTRVYDFVCNELPQE